MNFAMILRTFVGVTIFVLAVNLNSPATSILILVTPTRVLIAADSKEIDSRQHSVGQTCKILEKRGVYWAAAQIYRDPATGFDVEELVDRAMRQDGNIIRKMNDFVELAKLPLKKELAYLKAIDPEQYRKFTNQQNPLQIVFISFEGRTPDVVAAYFTASDAQEVIVEGHVQTVSPGNFGGLGEHEDARKYLNQHPNLLKADLAEAMRTLMHVEIEAHSQFVGPPISVLEIDLSGAKWREKGKCSESRISR